MLGTGVYAVMVKGTRMAKREKPRPLDPDVRSEEIRLFDEELRSSIIGQDEAVHEISKTYQLYRAGLTPPGRPISTMLFLGPSGVGKTRVVEAASDILFGSDRAFLKVDCAEFQHSHEVAKLLGSPAGYLGHRETPALLRQETLCKHQTEQNQFNFVLFDEIEKADDALWELLLGVLDKGSLTLGDTSETRFDSSIVVLTSNLGSRDIERMTGGEGVGFIPDRGSENTLRAAALNAARRKFTPEFMNRIDSTVVFLPLERDHFFQILELELANIQDRILSSTQSPEFVLKCTRTAGEALVDRGTDPRYGARHLKRALERYLVVPLANMIATMQIMPGDIVTADFDGEDFSFSRREGPLVVRHKDEGGSTHTEAADSA